MIKQVKLMILANIALGILFVIFNFIYDYFGNSVTHNTLWSPFWLTFYNYKQLAALGGTLGSQQPNFSFYFFWASIIINIFFIYELQKKKLHS